MKTARAVGLCLCAMLLTSCPAAIKLAQLVHAKDKLGPTIVVTSPADRSFYKPTVSVTGSVTDSAAGADDLEGSVVSLAYAVEGTSPAEAVPIDEGAFEFSFSGKELSGDLVVQLDATDWNGNTARAALTLRDDGVGPYVLIASPEDQSHYSTAVIVRGSVCDSESEPGETGEVKQLLYEVLGTTLPLELSFAEDGSFSFEVSTASFSGPRTIKVSAEDWQGHLSEAVVTLLSAGNDIPTFSAAPGNRQVTLTWDPVPFAESYTIYNLRYGSIVENATSPYEWSGLTNGTLYSFQLQATTEEGHGQDNWSAREDAIPLSSRTLAPWVREQGHRSITIDWAPMPAASECVVERAQSADGPGYVRTITSESSLSDTSLEHGTWYYYR